MRIRPATTEAVVEAPTALAPVPVVRPLRQPMPATSRLKTMALMSPVAMSPTVTEACRRVR